jgi:deoxyadenosine/deoxycytidine kinase
MTFRYIAIEGPIGVGKSSLAERLASRLDATAVLEEKENPFLADFYGGRPGAALQAQLFYLLNRHRQQLTLQQGDLFAATTVCDYLFDKDKIFAYVNLQAPTDVLARRLRDRTREGGEDLPEPGQDYLREINEAYQHYFFHYSVTPLLVVETSQFDLHSSDEALDDLIRQIRGMNRGTRYYVPRT